MFMTLMRARIQNKSPWDDVAVVGVALAIRGLLVIVARESMR